MTVVIIPNNCRFSEKKTWVSSKRRPKSKKRRSKHVCTAVDKKALADKNKGSWFNQSEQWCKLKEAIAVSAFTIKLNSNIRNDENSEATKFID